MSNTVGSSSRNSSSSTGAIRSRLRKTDGTDQAISSSNHLSLPASPLRSRSSSPLPATATHRQQSRHRPDAKSRAIHNESSRDPRTSSHRLQAQSSAPSLASLFGSSWTTLQGIASDLLNADGYGSDETVSRSRPRNGFQRSHSTARLGSWGPKSPDSLSTNAIGAGTSEQRQALVRAEKRKDLLCGAANGFDNTVRSKRRTSDDHGNLTDANEEDALLYVHRVQPNDTLAGISIRYACPAAGVQKANRMWANDAVQSRKVLVIPVASCSVRGKLTLAPLDSPTDMTTPVAADRSELITSATSAPGSTSITTRRPRNESFSNDSQRTSGSTRSTSDLEQSWTHDSWVLLPNATAPTQIVRLPRRTIGYFPPTRRKSLSTSDFDSRMGSLDIPRVSISEEASSSPLRSTRRMSNATNGYFPSYLAGPGGVGTLNKDVKSPGPAQDGLNKLFANHLPNVAPSPSQQGLYLPDMPLAVDYAFEHADGGRQSPGLNFENVGGAIESWMRKVANKASAVLEPERRDLGLSGRVRGSAGTYNKTAGAGELIEMAESFDIGPDESDDESPQGELSQRGRQSVAMHGSSSLALGGSGARLARTSAGRGGAAAGGDKKQD